ncbi:MAG: indole-3-glycerol phosphate synthase TrpC, partial [Clostridia bacterium]|nr:indole-3-glycerol phosphate synthase TrpC [Clostridia bacterium]
MILDDIARAKKRRVEDLKQDIPYERLELLASQRLQKPLDLYSALKAPGLSVIAEVKRASPSKGIINDNVDPVQRALQYVQNGASAISVLTEQDYFLGHAEDLESVKASVSVPVLCKDFILEEYQILYAYAKGADAILLIAALLDDDTLTRLYKYARGLGLSVLLEVHDEKELFRIGRTGGRIVGVNNRNLKTFHVDLKTFGRLKSLIPKDCASVCESGIRSLLDAE